MSPEVFVNGGEKVLTTLIFPEKDAIGLATFPENGEAKLEVQKAWELGK